MESKPHRPCLLIVGAFPTKDSQIIGGIVTSCHVLMQSSLPERANLVLLDSTQASNPPPGFISRLSHALPRLLHYKLLLQTHSPDAVILFTSAGASAIEKGLMAWYAKRQGIAPLIFPRGGALINNCQQSLLTLATIRILFRNATHILCQGPTWQHFATNQLDFCIENAPIIPNWTATPALLNIGQRRVFAHTNRPVNVLFLGWVEKNKGIFELIEACRQLKSDYPFTLNIVGRGKASASAYNMVKAYGLDKHITFSGLLQEEDVHHALANADVLALPSWAEGLPNAMIEAMAAKLAVIVTAVGNIPDVVVDNHHALMIPPKNITALKNALVRIFDSHTLRQDLAEAGFMMVKNKFTVEHAVDNLLRAVTAAKK